MNLIATLMLATAFVGGGDDTRLLFFTSDQCPACHGMQPVVEHLKSKGYPIQEINTSQSASWADRFQITQVPTFVLVKGGKELNRAVGQLTAPEMAQMINNANAQQQETRGVANFNQPAQQSAPHDQQNAQQTAIAADHQFVSTSTTKSLTPKELAHQATVRLRVEDSRGANHGTGTIIHVHGKEALVLTCGHVFRDSQGQGEIFADIGFPGEPRTVRGKLLKYDAGDHDVALLVIELDRPLQAVAVADAMFKPRPGEALFSVGCDRGADPTVREGKMLRVSSYSNVHKYDVSNRPIDGRSGGGLFAADGSLIGVCNAADVNADEGIYAGLQSIYWQFGQAGLEKVFTAPAEQPSAEPDLDKLVAVPQQKRPTRVASIPDANAGPVRPAMAVNERPFDMKENVVPVTRVANSTDSDVEMIVIVRSRENPSQTKSIVVSDPTPELLRIIAAENLKAQRTGLNQMANGNLKTPARRIPRIADQQMRAQSPR